MGRQSNLGFLTDVETANTAGKQLPGLVGATAASASAVAALEGLLRTILIGVDSSGATVTVYDGTSTGGVKKLQFTAAANAAFPLQMLDIQFQVGIFVVISGGTTPNITFIYQ
jgi:hypothetical protein